MVRRTPQPPAFSGSPLASDEPNLARNAYTGPTEVGGSPYQLGLSGVAPTEVGGSPSMAGLNEFASAGLQPRMQNAPNISDTDFAQMMQQIGSQPLLQPSQDAGPQMFYSPSTGDMVVNGFTFNQRNASKALQSQQFASQPRREFTLPDTATDWRPLSTQEYSNYIDTIRNPSFGRRVSEGWEGGWRGAGDVAIGAGLAVAEATGNHWQWGEQARQNIAREYEENSPFIMGLQDVHDPGSFMGFAAQMVAQSMPWMVETIASMAAGALIGGAVSGGVGAPEGAIEGFIAKEGVRRATQEALRTTLRRGAAAYLEAQAGRAGAVLTRDEVLASAARTGSATADEINRFFNFGERAFHLSRGSQTVARISGSAAAAGEPGSGFGALGGTALSTYQMGVGDIRNTIADAGGDTTTATSIANIWGLALPYAAIESLGDLIISQPLTHIFPGFENGPSHIGNALRHAATAGAGEGIEEGAQYLIDQQAVASSTNTPIQIEPMDLLNNMAGGVFGGMAIGGAVGGMAHTSRQNNRNAGIAPPEISPSPINTDPYDSEPQQDMHIGSPDQFSVDPGAMSYPQPSPAPDERNTLAGMPPAQSRVQDERSYLRNTLGDPSLTPEQRDSILQALDALEGGRDVNTDSANRYQSTRGVTPVDATSQLPFGNSVPITNAELSGLQAENNRRDAINSADRSQVDLPPGLANTTTYSQPQTRLLPRGAEEIYKDMATGVPVPTNEMVQLRTAIAELASKNPTNPGYANVLSQLDDHIAQQRAVEQSVTDENSPEFRAKYPELARHIQLNQQQQYTQSPMDAAKGPIQATQKKQVASDSRQAIINKLGAGGDAVKNATDGQLKAGLDAIAYREAQPKWKLEPKTVQHGHRALAHRIQEEIKARASANDGLRGRTQQVEETPAPEDYIAKAEEAGKKARKNLKRKEERARQKERDKLNDKEAIKATREAIVAEDNAALGNREHKSEMRSPEGTTKLPLLKNAREPGTLGRDLNRKVPNAVQVESTKSIPVEEQPKGSPRVREAHAQGDQASGASETKGASEVPAAEQVSENRVDRAYKALIARAEGSQSIAAKDPAQSVRAILGVIKRAEKFGKKANLNLLKNPWLQIDGKVLTKEELLAVETKFGGERKTTQSKEEAPADKAERKLARFGDDLSDAFKRNKDDPKALPEFVKDHREEVTQWLTTADARSRAGLRVTVERLLRDNPEILRAAAEKTQSGSMTAPEIRKVIRDVQARITKNMRFNSVHVFTDVTDLLTKAHDETLITQGRPTVSLGRYIVEQAKQNKKDNPQYADLTDDQAIVKWTHDNFGGRAAVITGYNALIVMSNQIADTKKLLAALEHEYIVHRGLSALFPDYGARVAFLSRVAKIPGMEEKRIELLNRFPSYARAAYFIQIEEVLAFHAMEGPLALETLLSAKEGADTATKRTLWEDFKQLVADWISRVFPGLMSQSDKAVNNIIAALREHALLGSGENLNKVLDDLGVPPVSDAIALAIKEFNGAVLQAAAEGTPEATHEMLFGTNTEPGRPYMEVPWGQHMVAIMKQQEPLIEKLQEMADKGAGTAVNEALKKVGRNLETMGQMARRSMLVQKTMEIMHNTIGVARSIMTKIKETRVYAEKDARFNALRKLWGDKTPGSTEAQRTNYGKLAIVASNNRMAAATEEVVKAFPRILVKGADGLYSINEAVFEEALKRGTLTKEEFKAEKGVEQFVVSGDGKRTSTGFAKLSDAVIDSGYTIYAQESRHMAESMLTMLKNALIMLNKKNDHVVAGLIKDNNIAGADGEFTVEVLQRMYKLYSDIAFNNYSSISRSARAKQQRIARDVLAELMRTMHNKEKLKDWTDSERKRSSTANSPRANDAFKWREQTNPSDEVKPFANQVRWFLEKDGAHETRLHRLNSLGVKPQPQYDMLGAFQGMLNSELMAKKYEEDTIQQTLGNYVEFTREGEWRVFLNVTDLKGNKISVIPELYAMLPVSYTKSEREAKQLMEQRGEELKGEFTISDEDGNPIKVKFDPGYEKAPGASTLAEAPSVKEFLRVADIVGIKLSAPQMKQIANLIENAAQRKRLGLQRANTPGMDAKVLENNSKTLTRRAWASAKLSQSWMLDSVFDDEKNIYGDPKLLKQLQDNFDIANRGAPEGTAPPVGFVRNEAAVWLAERDLLEYANQMKYMSKYTLGHPTIDIRTTKGETKLKIEPEGRAHLDHAQALRESLKRDDLEVNLNDLLSKTGPLRMMAVVMQLGSIASGLMNAFGIITHLPWVLIANNTKTGYGTGFQFNEVMQELGVAVSQVFNPFVSLDNSGVLKEALDKARAGNNPTQLSLEELEFMYQQTLEGELAAQQTYSLTGGTESNITNLLARNVAEMLLKPFGAVEAANRRVAALVTYRLAKARYLAAGKSAAALADHDSDEYKQLTKDVQFIIRNTQGDYSNVNTPKAFRGDLAKYVMLYKMFPLMTVQMINNLPYKQQLSVLAVLFLLGGLKSEPFADDLMDIYDTLLQKLGVRHDSVELELIQTLERIMPGSSRWIMTGAVDTLAFGGTMSSRVSMGDIIPFTGALREGADWGRELNNAFGPAYSANSAVLEWGWLLTDFVLQSAGIKPQVTSAEELIRKFPQTQIRAIGEAILMGATGQITDPQGRLTSDDVTAWTVLSRAIGLYPLEATKANTAVRLDRMHIGYMRAVRSRFILAYANAYRAHDEHKMEALRQQVNSWNEAARQNGQEDMLIRNFSTAAVRAGRAASQTTVERTIASAPDYSMLEDLAGILNADTTTDDESGDQ